MKTGRIIKNISDNYTVLCEDKLFICKARGKFRNIKKIPLVGDIVEFDSNNNYIMNILPRRNELKRPSISNIDIALIMASLKKPDLSLNLLDKELVSIILSKLEPVICFTKLDLGTKEEIENLEIISKYYESLGIKVFKKEESNKLIKYLKGKYVVLTGQTGAGKSSFLNKLDSSLNLKEGEISLSLNRGKHTTRHTEFYQIKDVFIADTPGFSALDLSEYSLDDIKDAFLEFKNYSCQFKDCSHIKEDNCEVKKQVLAGKILKSRYDNYCNFIKR